MRRSLALVALVGSLAACGGHPAAAPSPRSTTTTPSHSVESPAAHHASTARSLTLLPRSCTLANHLRLRSERATGGGTGERIWLWRLTSRHPCTIVGRPRVSLLSADGARMPYDFGPWGLSPIERIARPVAVGPRGTLLAIDKYRCDSGARSQSVRARVTLPQTGDSFVVAAKMELCDPAQDGPNDVGVAPIGGWGEQSWPVHPYAVHVGSSIDPAGHATWGQADIDGDGRRDVVIAHRNGRLEVRTAARTLMLKLPHEMTRRIQGFGDLNGDGHPEILLGSTALGIADGYTVTDGVVRAVTYADGRLLLVGGPRWALRVGAGHGDYYAGFTCAHGTVTQLAVLLAAPPDTPHTYQSRRAITWQVSGTQVHRLRRRTTIETGDPAELTRTHCPRR